MSTQSSPDADSSPNLVTSWCNLALQVTETNSIIVITDKEFQSWNEHEKNTIINEYYHLTATDGMFVRDSAIARIFLGPTVYFQQKNIFYIAGQLPVLFYDFNDPNYQFGINGVNGLNNPTFTGPSPPLAANNNNSPAAAKEKIPRPPNAFILYRKFHHPSIVAQHPGIHNNAVSSIIGKMWSTEKPEVLAEWKSKAEKVKQDHLLKYPGYQYQPRKPAEKKRRRSSKKKLECTATPSHKASQSPSTSSHEISSSVPQIEPALDVKFEQQKTEIPAVTPLPDISQYQVVHDAESQISNLPSLIEGMDNRLDILDHAGMPGIADYRHGVHDMINYVGTDILPFPAQLLKECRENGWL